MRGIFAGQTWHVVPKTPGFNGVGGIKVKWTKTNCNWRCRLQLCKATFCQRNFTGRMPNLVNKQEKSAAQLRALSEENNTIHGHQFPDKTHSMPFPEEKPALFLAWSIKTSVAETSSRENNHINHSWKKYKHFRTKKFQRLCPDFHPDCFSAIFELTDLPHLQIFQEK